MLTAKPLICPLRKKPLRSDVGDYEIVGTPWDFWIALYRKAIIVIGNSQ